MPLANMKSGAQKRKEQQMKEREKIASKSRKLGEFFTTTSTLVTGEEYNYVHPKQKHKILLHSFCMTFSIP